MDEGMLIATWWGVGAAGLFGLSGLLVGIVGLVQAKNARSTAAAANLIAKAANTMARQANTFAADANGIARDANTLAEEANAITKREAERGTELHRIDWCTDWDTPGRYRVENLGPDAATNVRAQITVDDETVVGEAERLEPGGAVVLDFPRALATYRQEKQERIDSDNRRNAQRDRASGGPFGQLPFMADLNPLHGSTHLIRDLITWRSPAGNPQERDEEHRLSRLER